ncbi:carboxypeptidase-like regulatory domain-containing protein [Salinimicrobium sp. TIG7-5_MAKvit]|uniref:carboxypeptidase-like regulatory domain-containing protein n=1 Tax=Salinimicrobium sp. TIG7-5_MAKvit TaxID=3121289 RepID=UPI003C6E708B
MKKIVITTYFLLFSIIMLGQTTVEVSGKVVDNDSGIPIPGVNIIEKGTTNGTMTDFDGNFVLEAPAHATLVISYLGYTTQEININNKSKIDIALQQSAAALDEVVVVGYGTQKKVNLTGSVASVDGDMLESRAITSVSAGLSGLLPGVSVRQSSGMPGADGGTIRIRGTGTLNQPPQWF